MEKNRIRFTSSHCLIDLPANEQGWRRTLFLEGDSARSFRERLVDQLFPEKELSRPSSSLELRIEEENGQRQYYSIDREEWEEILKKRRNS